MPERRRRGLIPGYELDGGVALVRFSQALSASTSFERLERKFREGFGRLVGVRMYGFNVVEAASGQLQHHVAVGVSDVFVARYVRDAMHGDPLRAYVLRTGRPLYNMAMMSTEEWLDSPVYRHAYHTHEMRHVVEAAMVRDDSIVGNLHFARSDPEREFTSREVRLAEVLARVVGHALEGIRTSERVEVERDQALAALELAGTAVVTTDPHSVELRLNGAARDLITEVVDGEERVHRLITRPLETGAFSRRIDVELVSGGAGVLHGHTSPVRPGDALVTVLELQREEPGIPTALLATLTPRETEVAGLVAEGLSDREIADRLDLSHHTVSQYVKRIYRKLNVDSRVALTRLLLRPQRSLSQHR